MKKSLTLFLTTVLCLCCLASCSSAYKENTWFSEEKLTNCLVDNLPAIENEHLNHNNEDIYVNFTSKERESYAAYVLEYLKSQDLKYIGTRGEQQSTLAGIFTTYYFDPADELESFLIEGDYIFVFSDGSVDENGDVEFIVLVIYDVSTNTLEYGNKKFTYNTQISLRRGSEAPLGGFYVLKEEEHEHIFTYTSAGEIGHYITSSLCGCSYEEGTLDHFDENIDCICDACGYDMNEDYPPLVDVTTSLTQFASWLTELNTENVAEIKTTFEYVGVAPGRLKDISRTTDKTVIADVLDKYASTKMRPVAREETYISGGSAFTIEFTLTDGTVKQLYFNNGFYTYGLDQEEISALCYFELCSIPTLKGYDSITKSNGFITYLGTGTVYDKDNNSVCEIPIDELEFVESDGCVDAEVTGYYYTVETEFGTLHFDYSNDLFYLRFSEGEDDYREYYRIVGKNLDELIAEYSATTD